MLPSIEKPEQKQTSVSIPDELPIIPSGESVVYPSMIVPLAANDEKTIKLVDEAATGDKIVGLFAQRQGVEEPPPANLYGMGTAASIAKMLKMPDGSIRAFLQGISRVRLAELVQVEPYLRGRVERVEVTVERTPELEALMRNIVSLFQKVVALAPNLPDELAVASMNLPDPGSLADLVAAHVNLNLEESQEILETLDVQERMEKLTSFINRELEILELRGKIQSQVRTEVDKAQREFLLREQLKAIQKELGEVDERTVEVNELRAKIEEAALPAEARKEAERELDRLAKMPPQAAEYSTARTYLDWLTALP